MPPGEAKRRSMTKRPAAEEEAILDELRLRGDYAQLRRDALLRLLARRDDDAAPDRKAVKRATW